MVYLTLAIVTRSKGRRSLTLAGGCRKDLRNTTNPCSKVSSLQDITIWPTFYVPETSRWQSAFCPVIHPAACTRSNHSACPDNPEELLTFVECRFRSSAS